MKKYRFTGVIDDSGDLVSKSRIGGVFDRFIAESDLTRIGGLTGFREGFQMTISLTFRNDTPAFRYLNNIGYERLLNIDTITLLETH